MEQIHILEKNYQHNGEQAYNKMEFDLGAFTVGIIVWVCFFWVEQLSIKVMLLLLLSKYPQITAPVGALCSTIPFVKVLNKVREWLCVINRVTKSRALMEDILMM